MLFQNKINLRYCASSWSYYRTKSRCTVIQTYCNILAFTMLLLLNPLSQTTTFPCRDGVDSCDAFRWNIFSNYTVQSSRRNMYAISTPIIPFRKSRLAILLSLALFLSSKYLISTVQLIYVN